MMKDDMQIIVYRLDGEIRYALYQMINGRVTLTPCDSDGNVLEVDE